MSAALRATHKAVKISERPPMCRYASLVDAHNSSSPEQSLHLGLFQKAIGIGVRLREEPGELGLELTVVGHLIGVARGVARAEEAEAMDLEDEGMDEHSPESSKEVIEAMDKDKDGKINAVEFDGLCEDVAFLPRRHGLAPGWERSIHSRAPHHLLQGHV